MSLVKDAVDFFDMVGQTEWHRGLQRTLVHWIGLQDRHEVLDVGCGAGHFLLQLAQRSKWVTGLDVSAEMVRRAELNAEDHKLDNASLVVGDVKDLPFPDGKFDIVTCLNLVFMYDNPAAALRELVRVAKPDGAVILLNPSESLNPWSAQEYCEKNVLRDFERDSLLSWGTVASRYGAPQPTALEQAVSASGGILVESQHLLDGLAVVSRIAHATDSSSPLGA